MEVHERVVLRRVQIAGSRRLRRVGATDVRVAAGLRVGGRVAHVLLVGPPGAVGGVELVGERLHRRRVHAALSEHLAEIADACARELAERRAVALGRGVRTLPADLCDVVVEARVADGEVLGEELALRGQRPAQIRRFPRAERLVVALVLEVDHEDVTDPRRRFLRRGRDGGRRSRGETHGDQRNARAPPAGSVRCPTHGRRGYCYARSVVESRAVVHANVLIVAEPARIAALASDIADLGGVSAAYSVAGDEDIVVVIRVSDHESLADLVTGRIAAQPGVLRTRTLIAFRVYSQADLESI